MSCFLSGVSPAVQMVSLSPSWNWLVARAHQRVVCRLGTECALCEATILKVICGVPNVAINQSTLNLSLLVRCPNFAHLAISHYFVQYFSIAINAFHSLCLLPVFCVLMQQWE